ncbi:MAG: Dihydroorotate dehydrogenase B (NAD(+)), catalytic subunit [Phycisphaerae bacterium]|nr:Dihydroorotate dehydrogenase B (NAD(+)), catalytic subunit [Phycisphaerae bacterium]
MLPGMNASARPADPRLHTTLCGLSLRTPVLTASGTCGYGPEYAPYLDYHRLGGFTTKSVTRNERPGNEPQRIVEVRGGIINAIGLANVGLERFLSEKMPFIRQMPTAVFVNVAGHSIEDYHVVAERLDAEPAIAGIELNVSCPNVADGLMFGTDARRLAELVSDVRRVVKRAVLVVKLSPNVTDICELARAAIAGGADALSMVNTFVALSVDIQTWRPCLANGTGGLSGPAIKPLALNLVHRVYRDVARAAGVPIIGMGGIQTWADAVEFVLAGATAVAVGTALFIDPAAPMAIADGLSEYVAQRGLDNVAALVGRLRMPGEPAGPEGQAG